MPNDYRITRIPIPEQIDKGDYMATVLIDYGDEYNLEAAELQFKYE